jgi:hypothetical protein
MWRVGAIMESERGLELLREPVQSSQHFEPVKPAVLSACKP